MLCAEVTLYPQKTTNGSNIINDAIKTLSEQQISHKVGSLSTHIDGNDEQVWQGLKAMFDKAKNSGEVNMVVTISNSAH